MYLNAAILSHTSNTPQHDIRSYLGLYTTVERYSYRRSTGLEVWSHLLAGRLLRCKEGGGFTLFGGSWFKRSSGGSWVEGVPELGGI